MRSSMQYMSALICCGLALLACDGTNGEGQPGGASTGQGRAATPQPTVVTLGATEIDGSHARLALQVVPGSDGVTECGVCWGPSVTDFATQTSRPWKQRCMRQIPCRGNAYFTNDGYMYQREYAAGETYRYKAYAIDGAGRITYGADVTFTVPWITTATCGDALSFRDVRLGSTAVSMTSRPDLVPFTELELTVCNPTPTVLDDLTLQQYIEQGGVVVAAGGRVMDCWFSGNARTGLCPTKGSVVADDARLVPGPATLVVQLEQGEYRHVLLAYRTAITLVP